MRKLQSEEAGTQDLPTEPSHAYDRFHDTASSRRVKYRKNGVPASSDEGL